MPHLTVRELNALLPLPRESFQILVSLADGDRHGYSILQEVTERTEGRQKLSPSTLYTTIRRLLDQGFIEESAAPSASNDERRRYYRLTGAGREVARAEARRLERLLESARASGLLSVKR